MKKKLREFVEYITEFAICFVLLVLALLDVNSTVEYLKTEKDMGLKLGVVGIYLVFFYVIGSLIYLVTN